MVTEIEKLTDICSVKHGGNEESRNANLKNLSTRDVQRMQVFHLIAESPNGLSMKEVAEAMGLPFNCVSGRGSELKKLGYVEPTEEVRNGSRVLRAVFNV